MSAAEKSPPASSADSPPPATAGSPATAAASGDASTSTDGAAPSGAPPAGFVMPPGMAQLAGMQFVPYFPPVAPTGEGGDSNAQSQPQMMIHPAFLSQMYSYPYPGVLTPGMKLKRKQVKNACTNCQKACKKCDDERPCPRCVKYGIAEECIDSVRKERRKGIKRGSYKKKCKHTLFCVLQAVLRALALPAGLEEEMESAPSPTFMPGYPAALYQQWAAAAMSAAAAGGKPGEGGAGYYPYFIAPAPQGSEGAAVSPEGAAAAAVAAAANPYFAQMYYGAAAAGYPPGYPVPGFSGDAAAPSSSKQQQSAPKGAQESEDELEAEEEDEEEPPESPKRKTKKKPRESD